MASIDKLIDLSELETILRELGEDVVTNYRTALENRDHVATGNLLDSISATVDVDGTIYEVNLHLADYWKYLERGTPAHWPPRSAILKWIDAKGIIPRPDEHGRIPTKKSLAFLISRSIAGESPNQSSLRNPDGGTIGTHGLEATIDAVMPLYKERLKAALGKAYGDYIRSIISFSR